MKAILSIFYGSVSSRLLSGAAWSIGGMVVERIAQLAMMILIARVLGKELLGELSLVQSTIASFAVLASAGIGVTTTRYVAELKSRNRLLLSSMLSFLHSVLLICLVFVSTVIFVWADTIAEFFLNSDHLSVAICIAVIALFFNTLNGFQVGCLTGFEHIQENAIVGAVSAIMAIPIAYVLTLKFQVLGAVWGLAFSAIMRWILAEYFLGVAKRKWGIDTGFGKILGHWNIIKEFALPALLSGLLLVPAHWICQSMLANANSSKGEIATLAIVIQWFYAMLLIPLAANRVIAPILTDVLYSSSIEDARKVLHKTIIANAIVVVPAAIVVSIFSQDIMVAYGNEFSGDWDVLVLALSAGALSAIAMPLGQMFSVTKKMWAGFALNAVWATVYIASSYFAIDFGAIGVMSSLVLAYVVHLILSFILLGSAVPVSKH